MHDLVAEYGREFRLRTDLGQQPAIDGYLAAGQRPRIRDRVVEHGEFVGQVHIADCRETVAHRANVSGQRRVDIVRAALRLLHGHIVLGTHGEFLLAGDQHELGIAGYRVDRAAADRRQRQDCNE